MAAFGFFVLLGLGVFLALAGLFAAIAESMFRGKAGAAGLLLMALGIGVIAGAVRWAPFTLTFAPV